MRYNDELVAKWHTIACGNCFTRLWREDRNARRRADKLLLSYSRAACGPDKEEAAKELERLAAKTAARQEKDCKEGAIALKYAAWGVGGIFALAWAPAIISGLVEIMAWALLIGFGLVALGGNKQGRRKGHKAKSQP